MTSIIDASTNKTPNDLLIINKTLFVFDISGAQGCSVYDISSDGSVSQKSPGFTTPISYSLSYGRTRYYSNRLYLFDAGTGNKIYRYKVYNDSGGLDGAIDASCILNIPVANAMSNDGKLYVCSYNNLFVDTTIKILDKDLKDVSSSFIRIPSSRVWSMALDENTTNLYVGIQYSTTSSKISIYNKNTGGFETDFKTNLANVPYSIEIDAKYLYTVLPLASDKKFYIYNKVTKDIDISFNVSNNIRGIAFSGVRTTPQYIYLGSQTTNQSVIRYEYNNYSPIIPSPTITSITNSTPNFDVSFNDVDVIGAIYDPSFAYLYSLNGGTTFTKATQKASPITIDSGINDNTIYRVAIKHSSSAGDSSISNMVPAIRRSTNVQVASGVSSTTPTVITNFTNSVTVVDSLRTYVLNENFGPTETTQTIYNTYLLRDTSAVSLNNTNPTQYNINSYLPGWKSAVVNLGNGNYSNSALTVGQYSISFRLGYNSDSNFYREVYLTKGTYNLNFRTLARLNPVTQQSLSVRIYNSSSTSLPTRTFIFGGIGMNNMYGTSLANAAWFDDKLNSKSYKSYDFIVPSDGSYNLEFSSKSGNDYNSTLTIFIRDVVIENLTLPKPWGVYIAGHPQNTSDHLFDITGQGRHADIGGSGYTTGTSNGNGATVPIPYIGGTTLTTITWPTGSIPPSFTLSSITRVTTPSEKAVLMAYGGSSTNIFFVHGHWYVSQSYSGVAYYYNGSGVTGWKTKQPGVDATIPIPSNLTDWLVMCGSNGTDTTPNNILANGTPVGTFNGGTNAAGRLRINTNSQFASNFQFQQLVIWDVSLNNYQLSRISTLQNNYLQTGTIKYPFAVISTPPVITNITNDGVSSFSVYFTQHVVGSADASFAYLYSLDGGTTYKDSLQTESPITISGIRSRMPYKVVIKHISFGGDSGPSNVVYASINGSVPNNSVQYRNIDNSNIIRYYPFDTDLWDYSSGDGSNNATNTSSLVALSKMPTGLGRGSARFPANPGQSFKIPNVTFGSGGITVAFWMALYSIPTTQTSIFEFTDASSSPTDTVGLRIGNGTTAKLMFVTGTNTTTDLSYTVPTNDLNQHHYAIVFKQPSNTVDLYIDGVFKTTTSVTYPSTSTLRTSCLIGKSNNITLTNYINCTLNQFVMFNRELTSTEIGYLKTNPLDVRFTSNLTGLSSPPPVITSITNDGTSFNVNFTQDITTGSPTAYFYSLDGGITFAPNSQPNSPITITSGIRSKIVYKVVIKNRNSAGDSKNSNIMAAVLS